MIFDLNLYTIRIQNTKLVTYLLKFSYIHLQLYSIRNVDYSRARIYNIGATSIYQIRQLKTTIGAFYKLKQGESERREIR